MHITISKLRRKIYVEKVKETGAGFPGITMRADDISDPFGLAPPPPAVERNTSGSRSGKGKGGRRKSGEREREKEKSAGPTFADEEGSQQDDQSTTPAIMVTCESNQSEFIEPVPQPLSRKVARRAAILRRGSNYPPTPSWGPPSPGAAAPAPPPPSVQVLTIPQLDNIQRTQKVLDTRLQVLQQQTEAINISDSSLLFLPMCFIHFVQ